jgi:beta-lactamase class A
MRLPRLSALILTTSLLAGCASVIVQAPAPTPVLVAPPVTAAPVRPARSAPVADESLQSLKNQLEEYLQEQSGTYGVYVIDIATGTGVGINADMVFPAASTFKLPMAMYLLDLAERGQISLDETLTYTSDDYEEGTGTLQDWVGDGDELSVRELIQLAITESDNIATNMLMRRFGRENVYDFMHQIGGQVTTYEDTNGTTPREMANYMRLAQTNKVVSDPQLRKFLIDLLSHTVFTDRAAAGVPDGVKVAHKVGTLPGVVNDVALVYAPHRTFVVSVFSTDVDDEAAPQVIAEITRRVYDVERDLAAAVGKANRG